MRAWTKRVLRSRGWELRRVHHRPLPRVEVLEAAGVRFPFWIANPHADEWWGTNGVTPSAEWTFLERSLAVGGTFIDVGAHHGILTVAGALRVGPGGSVHAFEANAANALVLQANVTLNGCPWARTHHKAVAAEATTLLLGGEVVGRAGADAIRVDAVDLDSYAAAEGIDAVDLLKIDVEGFETDVLEGAQETLRRTRSINLELHVDHLPRYGSSVDRVLDLCGTENFDVVVLARDASWTSTSAWSRGDPLPRPGVLNLLMTRR